jgi:hypothetical protein
LRTGKDLLETVRGELADERARKDSIESRALTISAAAAGATALVFGLGSDYSGRWQGLFFFLLWTTGVLFLTASGLGWWSVRLVHYEQPKLEELRRLVDGGGDPDIDDLNLYVADGLMSALEDARSNNNDKVGWFERAFTVFFIGVGFVALELGVVVADKIAR